MKQYVHAINQVLDSKIGSRSEAISKYFDPLMPPKHLVTHLQTAKFIDGTFVPCRLKNVAIPSTTSEGEITCCVCKQDLKTRKIEKVLSHFFSVQHHKKCKAILDKDAVKASQDLLKGSQSQSIGAYCICILASVDRNAICLLILIL